jgi:hypothetical protein
VSLVTNPRSGITHVANQLGYFKTAACGVDATGWPDQDTRRPVRFCAHCFSPSERDVLTEMYPPPPKGDAQ